MLSEPFPKISYTKLKCITNMLSMSLYEIELYRNKP